MHAVYCYLLLLLPADFRRAFGPAMSTDFATLLRDARRHGVAQAASLATREYLALFRSAPGEWLARLGAAPFQRDMIFRDRSRMRPPGVSKSLWYGRN